MTCEEIFTNLSEHIIKGLMIHEQLANYYHFLNLSGYATCHEYHFMKESKSYRELCKYYITHYDKLIPETQFDNPEVIPESWYQHTRQDVDANTKRNAVKQGLVKWVDWEMKTKKLYSDMYKEVLENGNVDSACFIKDMVKDVSKELKHATSYLLDKEAIDYDMPTIIQEQKCKKEKYKEKIKAMGE